MKDPYFRAKELSRSHVNKEYGSILENIEQDEREVRPSALEELVHNIIESDYCSESQRHLYYNRFGLIRSLEDIRQEESGITGRLVNRSAMSGRKDRLIKKIAKMIGPECESVLRY